MLTFPTMYNIKGCLLQIKPDQHKKEVTLDFLKREKGQVRVIKLFMPYEDFFFYYAKLRYYQTKILNHTNWTTRKLEQELGRYKRHG